MRPCIKQGPKKQLLIKSLIMTQELLRCSKSVPPCSRPLKPPTVWFFQYLLSFVQQKVKCARPRGEKNEQTTISKGLACVRACVGMLLPQARSEVHWLAYTWPDTEGRLGAAERALKIWPLKLQMGRGPQGNSLSPYKPSPCCFTATNDSRKRINSDLLGTTRNPIPT